MNDVNARRAKCDTGEWFDGNLCGIGCIFTCNFCWAAFLLAVPQQTIFQFVPCLFLDKKKLIFTSRIIQRRWSPHARTGAHRPTHQVRRKISKVNKICSLCDFFFCSAIHSIFLFAFLLKRHFSFMPFIHQTALSPHFWVYVFYVLILSSFVYSFSFSAAFDECCTYEAPSPFPPDTGKHPQNHVDFTFSVAYGVGRLYANAINSKKCVVSVYKRKKKSTEENKKQRKEKKRDVAMDAVGTPSRSISFNHFYGFPSFTFLWLEHTLRSHFVV